MILLIFVSGLLIASVALIIFGMRMISDYESELAELENPKQNDSFNIGIFRNISD